MDIDSELRDAILQWRRALRHNDYQYVVIYRTRMRILKKLKARREWRE